MLFLLFFLIKIKIRFGVEKPIVFQTPGLMGEREEKRNGRGRGWEKGREGEGKGMGEGEGAFPH